MDWNSWFIHHPSAEMVTMSLITKASIRLLSVRSDKDTHFTTSLAQDAIDIEELTDAIPTTGAKITQVMLWSDQNLDWDVVLFTNDTAQPDSDLDDNAAVDWIELAGSDAKQIAGTGPFLYSLSGFDIRYIPDDDNMYVGLVNRSGTAKNVPGWLEKEVLVVEKGEDGEALDAIAAIRSELANILMDLGMYCRDRGRGITTDGEQREQEGAKHNEPYVARKIGTPKR